MKLTEQQITERFASEPDEKVPFAQRVDVELLRAAVQLPILMGAWFSRAPDCTTIGCIAGNICIAAGLEITGQNCVKTPLSDFTHVPHAALLCVRLTIAEELKLFYSAGWPKRLQGDFVYSTEHVVKVVEDFIATDGWANEVI